MGSLILFQDMEDFPLVVEQHEFEVRWKQTDALYFFTDGQPVYVVDEDVFMQWSSVAMSDVPQAFRHGDATSLATYHALMLLLSPFCCVNLSTGETSPDVSDKKVFSAVVLFVHPSQQLSSIEEAVDMLLEVSCDPESVPASALCCLPDWSIGEFYPCSTHSATLVLPLSMGQDDPILHLNMPMHHCDEFAVQHLHQWVHPYGPVTALPPCTVLIQDCLMCIHLMNYPCCGQTPSIWQLFLMMT